MTLKETINGFNSAYNHARKTSDTKFNFYCGITNDLERRNREHNISNIVYWVSADSFEAASNLEKALRKEGYDTGKKTGIGTQDSTIVYMYRKTTSTVE